MGTYLTAYMSVFMWGVLLLWFEAGEEERAAVTVQAPPWG
jgi:hypothetical protein